MKPLKTGILIGVALLGACTETIYEVLPVAQLQVDAVTSTILPGTSVQLNARVSAADGTALSGRTITWTSSNTAVATVSGAGMLQAVAPGTTTLTASAEGQSGTLAITVQSPVPVITTISPSSVAAATAFQLTVTGSGFYSGSVVQLNNTARTTQFVSPTSLRVAVAAADFPNAGTVPVRVVNQPPGGGTSNVVNLTVTAPTMTVVVTNQLIRSINVEINGVAAGIVNASSTSQFTGPRVPITVSFTLNRQTTTTGVPVGETMAGTFATVTNPASTETFIVSNRIGSDTYFAPVIDNRTAVPFLMGVNMGLVAENRCNCTVPAFTSNIAIGYYRLFTNSNVRAYNDGSNYTGNFVFWEATNLQPFVTAGSGRTDLFSTVTPSLIASGEARIGFADVVSGKVHRSVHPHDLAVTGSNTGPQLPIHQWKQTVREPARVVTRRPEGQ